MGYVCKSCGIITHYDKIKGVTVSCPHVDLKGEGFKVTEKTDMVNHPPHYKTDNGIECIDAIEAALGREGFLGMLRGNVIKYLWRAGKKGDKHLEDMKKARWYLDRYIITLEKDVT